MRSFPEIHTRISERRARDILGFETNDLIVVLPFSEAKQYLVEGANESEWQELPRDRDAMLARMLEYMPFAWEKANDQRGISASRSISHYTSWVWLAGDDLGSFDDYQWYGKDVLMRICRHYGWDYEQWDNGERSNG